MEAPRRTLSSLSRRDIEVKLTEENITVETFSGFAARYVPVKPRASHHVLRSIDSHDKIMEIGWNHLGKELRTEKTTASILELIKDMRGGKATHQADTLKFGLYHTLRQKGPAENTLARLRCTNEKCSVNKDPISYDALGGGTSCKEHSIFSRMECSECGESRTDRGVWCKGCRRLFQ
jgi:hypothetical protein